MLAAAAPTLEFEEPVFPEDEGGGARRLDFYAHTIPPLYRELRRELAAHYARSALAPAWYVPRPFDEAPYHHFRAAQSEDDLPRLIADAGPRAFARREFATRWPDAFAPLPAPAPRPEFVRAGLPDPEGLFRVYGGACWVILADLERLGDRPAPRGWTDLFHARYRHAIAVNGERGGLTPLLLANLAKDFGPAALSAFARNVHGLYGGGEMARTAGSGKPDRAAVYVVPWFWAENNIHKTKTRVVWPEEGAYATPLLMLARRELTPGAAAARDFLTGARWTARMESICCAAADLERAQLRLPGELRWVGWALARDPALDALIAEAALHFRQGLQA